MVFVFSLVFCHFVAINIHTFVDRHICKLKQQYNRDHDVERDRGNIRLRANLSIGMFCKVNFTNIGEMRILITSRIRLRIIFGVVFCQISRVDMFSISPLCCAR